MIKSLFDVDENEKDVDKADGSLSIVTPVSDAAGPEMNDEDSSNSAVSGEGAQPVVPFEPEKLIGAPADDDPDDELEGKIADIEAEIERQVPMTAENAAVPAGHAREVSKTVADSPETPDFNPKTVAEDQTTVAAKADETAGTIQAATIQKEEASSPNENQVTVQPNEPSPQSATQSIRNSGLAYSAAIALTGSIVFMLIMGWFADLLLGISPWGIVIGIVLGATIGFIQFFRLTSQIVNPKPTDFEKVSLLNQADEPEQYGSEVDPIAGSESGQQENPFAQAELSTGQKEHGDTIEVHHHLAGNTETPIDSSAPIELPAIQAEQAKPVETVQTVKGVQGAQDDHSVGTEAAAIDEKSGPVDVEQSNVANADHANDPPVTGLPAAHADDSEALIESSDETDLRVSGVPDDKPIATKK